MLQTWLRKPFTLKPLPNSISHTTSTNKDKVWFVFLLSKLWLRKAHFSHDHNSLKISIGSELDDLLPL